MYDATIGRFFSEDPIGLDGEDPNLYRYVGNDPVNQVDPSGLGPPTDPFESGIELVIDPIPPKREFEWLSPDKEKSVGNINFREIPSKNVTELLAQKSHTKAEEFKQDGKRVIVTPLIMQGKLVNAVLLENTELKEAQEWYCVRTSDGIENRLKTVHRRYRY